MLIKINEFEIEAVYSTLYVNNFFGRSMYLDFKNEEGSVSWLDRRGVYHGGKCWWGQRAKDIRALGLKPWATHAELDAEAKKAKRRAKRKAALAAV